MRLLLAEDERSLSRAIAAILKKTITKPTPYTTAQRRWNF